MTLKSAATYELIGKLINRKIGPTSDNELQEFLLQVHHQNIVIHGNDFFTADMNLLASVSSYR